MATLVVDPTRFYADGAVINWRALAKRREDVAALLANSPVDRVLQLRWILRADMGMPTEPFIVWRRPVKTQGDPLEKNLAFKIFPLFLPFGYVVVDWHGSMSSISVDLQVTPTTAAVMAFAGAPTLEGVVAYRVLNSGAQTVRISGQVMNGLLLTSGVTVTAIRGIASSDYSSAADWQKVEIVGLPVDKAQWGGVGKHATNQGLAGALTDPKPAAKSRLLRGTPIAGWEPLLAAGVPAPVWTAPDPGLLINEVNAGLLDGLRPVMAGFAPNQQAAQVTTVPVPRPENASGQKMSGSDGTTTISPLGVLLLGAGTDPFLSLVLGFGTAYPLAADTATVASVGLQPYDYMISARWEKGVNGASAAEEYAALVPAPKQDVTPPAPANMVTELMGYERPGASDGPWKASVRVSWDRLPQQNLLRVASFAAARAGVVPPEVAVALLEPRPSGGFHPIASTSTANPPDPEGWRLHAVARELPIPPNPGWRIVKCAAATEDIFGLWSPWVSRDHFVVQPAADSVRIVAATLKPLPPASGSVCSATLTVEFLWDWRTRRPDKIRFLGLLYASAFHGAPPPTTLPPGGLQKSLAGGPGAVLQIQFTGDVPSAPGATLIGLNADGDAQVSFGSAQGSESRRYRVTVDGFSLDYAATGHIGCALWAQGVERIPPQRVGPWSKDPSVITASDPRPPVIPIDHVQLASLPDAAGECHARISWTAAAGAAGYFIYESSETKILLANGLSEATPDMTLDTRLLRVKNAFHANPSRREFTRRNARLTTATSADVTIPRGSTAIHVYVVLGVSAGQVEANWPGGATPEDQLIAVAAPRVMVAAAPTLEVMQVLDQTLMPAVYKALVHVLTRKGPRVQKLELYRVRVDDAAKQLDTMGPPVAAVSNSGGAWTVTRELDGAGVSHITELDGIDAPDGSWKRVWYRAVAWSEDDPTRGALRGKSPASSAAWVVVPPSTPPDLSPLTMEWPGGPLSDVLVKWTSTAPVKKTPLGPHRLAVDVDTVGAPVSTTPLIQVLKDLEGLDTSAPATGSGVWRPTTVDYRALVRRAALTDAVKFAVRLTDPLGRMSERLLDIPPGPVDPMPDIVNVTLVKVAALGVVLGWASHAPLAPTSAGAYRLKLTAIRIAPPLPPWPPHPPVKTPPIVIDIALGDIPMPHGPGWPAGNLVVRRVPGGGTQVSYAALCRVPVSKLIVRITAPDGRFAEETREVH